MGTIVLRQAFGGAAIGSDQVVSYLRCGTVGSADLRTKLMHAWRVQNPILMAKSYRKPIG